MNKQEKNSTVDRAQQATDSWNKQNAHATKDSKPGWYEVHYKHYGEPGSKGTEMVATLKLTEANIEAAKVELLRKYPRLKPEQVKPFLVMFKRPI